MDRQQFENQLSGIAADAISEGADPHGHYLGLGDISRAIGALRDHKEGLGDLFMDTVPPTDDALLLIFAMIVLP